MPALPSAPSPLLTDLYELTMASAYWHANMAEQEAVFHATFRHNPFGGGFTMACGLHDVAAWLEQMRYSGEDLAYLASLRGSDTRPLFTQTFLQRLEDFQLVCDVDAMLEGTLVFPQEPLMRVRGPIWQCQLLESGILNLLNFHSLIATKAARLRLAAQQDIIIEFGLRRAQGVNGSLGASRAAYVGGCDATSNVLAGKLFAIPTRGTHAHSWVMAFDSESTAFERFAEAMPHNSILLVDTYDTIRGVRRAIEVGKHLRSTGHALQGIRLDSGDLAWLSAKARSMLDAAGFNDAVIVASNDLDEHLISSLKQQGAKIDVWGVGTKLVTAYDEPALGGVYKLSAIHKESGWRHRIKLSEQAAKISNPGMLQVFRFSKEGEVRGDMIACELLGMENDPVMVDHLDPSRQRHFDARHSRTPLLVPVFRQGHRVLAAEPLAVAKARAQNQLELFPSEVKRFEHPHQYPVGLERQLQELKSKLTHDARESISRAQET